MLNKMTWIENINAQGALFIICPFCQLESFLRTKFGDDIFFLTSPAAVLNFSADEVLAIREFIKREHIKDIFLVNEVTCNFIDEAIKNKKEFGLHCEKQLRVLLQNSNSNIKSQESLRTWKEVLAQNNVLKQLEYISTEEIFRHEISALGINIHGIITVKHEKNIFTIQIYKQE
ncbi:MAG: carbonic anhydrase [bacterium]|nr:carbonic anhydrase [bacterium]